MKGIGYYINKFKTKNKMTQREEAIARLNAIEEEQKKLRAIIEAPEVKQKPTTLKQACINQGVDYGDFLAECAKLPKNQSGLKKLTLICKDIRGSWKPTMENTWYYPWMKRTKQGFRFCSVGCVSLDHCAVLPVCLSLENSADAEYVGKTFETEFTEYMSPE